MANWVCRHQLGRGPVASRTGRLRAALHKDAFVPCNPMPASGGADVSLGRRCRRRGAEWELVVCLDARDRTVAE